MEGVLRALKDRVETPLTRCGRRIGAVPTRFAFNGADYYRMGSASGTCVFTTSMRRHSSRSVYHPERLRDSFYTLPLLLKLTSSLIARSSSPPLDNGDLQYEELHRIQDDRHRLVDHDHRLNEKVADLLHRPTPIHRYGCHTAGEGRMLLQYHSISAWSVETIRSPLTRCAATSSASTP